MKKMMMLMLVGAIVCMVGCGRDEEKGKSEDGPRKKTSIIAHVDKAAAINSVSELNAAWSRLLAKSQMSRRGDPKSWIVSATDFDSAVAALVSAKLIRASVASDQFSGCRLAISGTGESLRFIVKQD